MCAHVVEVLPLLDGFSWSTVQNWPCLSTEVLEEALVGSDPEGPLCELLFFFLSAIFQALDEEQEDVAKEQAEGPPPPHPHTQTKP